MTGKTRTERIIDDVEAASWVEDGMTIAVGDPAPMATVRQLVRRGVRGLTVVGSGLALDILIAGGCVARTMAYYAGMAGVAIAPAFRAAAEAGEIEVWECEEGCSPLASGPGPKVCRSFPGGAVSAPRCPK